MEQATIRVDDTLNKGAGVRVMGGFVLAKGMSGLYNLHFAKRTSCVKKPLE